MSMFEVNTCRCCAADSPSKDLISTYNWMGEEEVYSDMLRECFDIIMDTGEDAGICELCITQLRNAFNFKKQVLHTEEQFKNKVFMKERKINPLSVKVEVETTHTDESETDMLDLGGDMAPDLDSDPEYEVPIKQEKSEPKPKLKRAATKTKKAKKLKAEPQSSTNYNCRDCNKYFTTIFNLKRHTLNKHNRQINFTMRTPCEDCKKLFSNQNHLLKHKAEGCLDKTRKCMECSIEFTNKSTMYEHMRRCHWRLSLQNYHCPICDVSFKEMGLYDEHLYAHDLVLKHKELVFFKEEDFDEWKEKIELKDDVIFLKRQTANKNEIAYYCYPKKYLGHARVPGKSKTCPSRMVLEVNDGGINVKYQMTHVCSNVVQEKELNVVCPKCETRMSSYDDLHRHLVQGHSVEIDVQKLEFDSFDGPYGRTKKVKAKTSATPERVEHRVNLTAILQHSNATPFRDKTAHGFSCLYCAKYFQDINALRAHTALQFEKDKLNKMIDYKLSYHPIKVDITDLLCLICDTPMEDLAELKEHLRNDHKKPINKDIKDIILPFRLEDGKNFVCVVCGVDYVSFKNLYQHMSLHYRNYCCDQCGAGYICIAALRKHLKTHAQGDFPCSYCDKTYTSLSKKRNHEKGVHEGGWLRNKCPHCPETFVSYYDRSDHLVKVHNAKPITYACNACDKVYKKKFELTRHIRHFHLKQKSFVCNICNEKFCSRRGMLDHTMRHSGGEIFTCDVCGKKFARQRTLKEHLRTHEDDARYQCDVCNKKFTQKCSLKSHMRLHQDLDIFKEFADVNHLIDDRDLTLKQIAIETKRKAEEEKAAKEEQESYINL